MASGSLGGGRGGGGKTSGGGAGRRMTAAKGRRVTRSVTMNRSNRVRGQRNASVPSRYYF